MPIINTVRGDLVERAKDGEYDVIVHGCNTHCTMGSGIAPVIANAFEGVREADEQFPVSRGSTMRLGHYSYAPAGNSFYPVVVNAYTQHYFREKPDGTPAADYDAIRAVFEQLNVDIYETYSDDHLIGIPMLGAGLAGGDWETIESIINEVTPNLNIELVIFEPSL
tara:strand:+ start:6081 stop:6578 length:498 start_codon:yes stop_codon:yes gene_type:complete